MEKMDNNKLLNKKGRRKIYFLAVFAGAALNIIIFVVLGWVSVFISVAYQSNDSIGNYPEWLKLFGDSIFIVSILIGGFVAASIADNSEILNAIGVGIFNILFTILQLGLFERLYSDYSILFMKSIAMLFLAALGGYLAVVWKKNTSQNLTEYFDKK